MKPYLLLVPLLTLPVFGEYRNVTNKAGQVISARVLSLDGEMVKLERSDKRVFTIPLSSLSADEIKRINEELTEVAPDEGEFITEASELDLLRERLKERYPVDEHMSKTEASEAFRQALNYQKNKDFERAIEIWASIPKKRDKYADARRRAGYNVLGRELGRWDEALVFLIDAYDEEPKNKDILEDLGRAYLRLDDYENAKIYLKKAKTKNARKVLEELKEIEG